MWLSSEWRGRGFQLNLEISNMTTILENAGVGTETKTHGVGDRHPLQSEPGLCTEGCGWIRTGKALSLGMSLK